MFKTRRKMGRSTRKDRPKTFTETMFTGRPEIDPVVKHFLRYIKFEKDCTIITCQRYEHGLRTFNKFVVENTKSYDKTYCECLLHVEKKTLTDYLMWQKNKNYAPATIKLSFHILSTFYSWVILSDRFKEEDKKRASLLYHYANRGIRVKNPRKPREAPTQEEVQRLRKTIKDFIEEQKQKGELIPIETLRDRAAVEILIATGIRRQELLNIKGEDVDFEDHQILIKGKGRRNRICFFNGTVSESFGEYLKALKPTDERVFAIGSATLWRHVLKWQRLAGFEKLYSPHCFRHYFATNAHKEKIPLASISKMMGHSSISTTADVYLHFSVEDLREEYRKISGDN